MTVRAIGRLRAGGGGLTAVASLFAAGEQGGWWDASDFSTMYQDSAGTTPVTAVGQPVGMIRDKSGRGNHRTQATAASRPTLSARYNLLTYSQDVSNAAWTKSNVTTPDASTITDDATNGQHLIYQSPTMPAANVTGVAEVKQGTLRYVQVLLADANASARRYGVIVDTATGTVTSSSTTNAPTNTSAAVTATSDGYYRVTLKMDATTAGATYLIVGGSNSATPAYSATAAATYAGSGQSFNVRNLDLRTSADAALNIPSYQRVTTATDYDTTGFPLYLSYDGVDDSMATGSVDFSATDKMTVWAGITKSSDAALGCVVELTADAGANNGAFNMLAPRATGASGNFSGASRGTTPQEVQSATTLAPVSRVATLQSSISGPLVNLRLNGVEAATSSLSQGTGNYSNAVLYFGRRGGSTLPFNGREYCTIIRGAATSDSQIARVERFIASRMGVAL